MTTIETIATEHAATYVEQGATGYSPDMIAEGDLADLVERLGREATRPARAALTADELRAYEAAFRARIEAE